MPVRPFDGEAHRAALLLVEAVTLGRVRAQEEILARPDADVVALQAARLAAFLGPRVFRSRNAFVEGLRRAVGAMEEADAARVRTSVNGDCPDPPLA
jgi:hypothetical protein